MISWQIAVLIGIISFYFGCLYGDLHGFCSKLDAREFQRKRDMAYREIDKRSHERYLARLALIEKEGK